MILVKKNFSISGTKARKMLKENQSGHFQKFPHLSQHLSFNYDHLCIIQRDSELPLPSSDRRCATTHLLLPSHERLSALMPTNHRLTMSHMWLVATLNEEGGGTGWLGFGGKEGGDGGVVNPAHPSRVLLLCCAPPPTTHLRRTMTSTAPSKTAKNAAAAAMHGGVYANLAKLLAREVVDPSPKRTSDVLSALEREWVRRGGGGDAGVDAPSTIKLLEVTRIGRALARTIKLCKQHDRVSDKGEGWEAAVKAGGETLASMKAAANEEARRARSALATMTAAAAVAATGLPSSTTKF